MRKLGENGFSVVEGALIGVILLLIVGGGWWVLQNKANNSKPTQSTATQGQASPETAPPVQSAKDLDTAGSAMDGEDLDAGLNDANDLDSEAAHF